VGFERIDVSCEADPAAAIEREAARLQGSLDLERGPLMRAGLFDLGAGHSGRLLLAIHHLVVDGVSWRILLEDLQTAYEQSVSGRPIALPSKTTSYRQWAGRLEEHARSGALEGEIGYWLSDGRRDVEPLPVDHRGGTDTEGSARSVSVQLDTEQTRALLTEVPGAYRTEIDDALLAALTSAFAGWTGRKRLLIEREGHGREEIVEGVDLSRTVGWFTTLYPVVLEIPEGAGPGEALKSVKEQLRGVPGRGIGYGLLRYLSGDEELSRRLRSLPAAQVSFNYLGQIDGALNGADEPGGAAGARGSSGSGGTGEPAGRGLFAWAKEPVGPARSQHAARSHLFEIDARVTGGRLVVDWNYSESLHRRATVESLAADFVGHLASLIEQCRQGRALGYTPSDFPDVRLDQDKLDRVMKRVGGRAGRVNPQRADHE
jgi:non-ribosomal peptide synthase protein (TIGR01720 family)